MFNKNNSSNGADHITQILDRIKPNNCFSKTYRKDSDRLVYSELLQFSKKHLQDTFTDISTLQKSDISQIKLLGSNFFNPLFQQMIGLAQRQCSQRAILLKMLFNFYKQSIIITEKQYQGQLKQKIAQYVKNLQKTELQLNRQKQELSDKLKALQKQNQIKWKTFYMIVRDNRVLRRQKGKLMRVIQQERIKIANVHEEMVKVARENEKNRLLANYQQQQSLTLYLKNQVALQKLQKFMNDYPQHAKKILKFDMKTLQILEQNSLNSKVQYIIRAAKESQQILDEYEDLVDVEKPKAILFNVYVQTDSVQEQKITEKQQVIIKCHKVTQTSIKPLHFSFNQLNLCFNFCPLLVPNKRMKSKQKQLDKEKQKIVYRDKIIAINGSRNTTSNLVLIRKLISIKIFERKIKKCLILESNVITLNGIIQKERAPYPALPTNHRLSTGIRRSKEIFSRRQSQFSNSGFSAKIKLNQTSQNKVYLDINQPNKVIKTRPSLEEVQIQDFSSGDIPMFISGKMRNNQKANLRKKKTQKMTIIKTQPPESVQNKSRFGFEEQMQNIQFQSNRLSVNNYLLNPRRDQGYINQKNDEPRFSSTNRNFKKSAFNQTDNNVQKFKRRPSNSSKSKEQTKDIKSGTRIDNTRTDSRMSQDKNLRMTVQQRTVNIFGQESQRLIQKIFKAIVIKKKEITSGKLTFLDFLGKFMIHHFGPHLQISLSNSVGLRKNFSHLAEAFDRLLSSYQSQAYLQLIFSMFARMIVISDSTTTIIDPNRGEIVRRQLEKLYIGTKSNEFEEKDSQNDGNLCSIFICVQSQFNKRLKECELYIFLQSLLPCSQQTLSFEQLKQMLSIFSGEVEHLKQLMILGQEGQTQISPHMLCVYALRQNWTHLISITTYIQERYLSLFGEFDSGLVQKIIYKCAKSEKLIWSYALVRKNIEDVQSGDYSILKAKYFSMLFVGNYLQRYVPCSMYLTDIANQWMKLEMRKISE